jgi:ribosome biogenesis GTPase
VYDLTALGWDDSFAEDFEPYTRAGLIPGRVAVQHRGAYDVLTAEGELRCDVAGRLYDEAASPADLPAALGAARRPIAKAPETGLSQRARRPASCR